MTKLSGETTEALLRVESSGKIGVITLSSALNRNALSLAMIAKLSDALTRMESDAAVHAVILAAEGPAFSAGHDLMEINRHRKDADQGRAFFEILMQACSALMLQVTRMGKPVIAAVEGLATAAGCQLAATCDLVIAGERAEFQTPGVHIGLFCSTPMVALSRAVGRKAAMEMLLLGDRVSAADAHRIGLVNHVVPAGKAMEHALALAQRIGEKSAYTIAVGKRAFYEQAELPLAAAYELTARVMVENLLAGAACEGIEAFVQKRPAIWP